MLGKEPEGVVQLSFPVEASPALESSLHFVSQRTEPSVQAGFLDIIELLGCVKHCRVLS